MAKLLLIRIGYTNESAILPTDDLLKSIEWEMRRIV
jgi:hypothetical protein